MNRTVKKECMLNTTQLCRILAIVNTASKVATYENKEKAYLQQVISNILSTMSMPNKYNLVLVQLTAEESFAVWNVLSLYQEFLTESKYVEELTDVEIIMNTLPR